MSNEMKVDAEIRSSARGLSYSRRGTGDPVLLIHGWCLNRNVWMYLEHDLAERGFDVIAVDLAGYGASSELAGPFGLDRHGADIVALVEELNLNKVTAIGFAFGAAVVLSLPDDSRFAGYICIGVPTAAGARYDKMRSAMLRDWPIFAARSARAICAREHSAETFDWLGRMFMDTRLRVAVSGVEVLGEFDPLERTQSWSVPTLFVHGNEDTIVSLDTSRACVERFSGSRLHIVEQSGHLVPLDQPTALRDAVVAFIEDASA